MYIYLPRIFSFRETAESNHAFDTTVVRRGGMYEKLVNLYKMKSTVMFRNFIASKGGNVMIHKPHLTFHRNTEWIWLERLITDFTCLTFLSLCCCDLIENR